MSAENTILKQHWNRVSQHYRKIKPLPLFSRGYRRILAKYLNYYIPRDKNILEIGCATGELLNAVKGRERTGLDLCQEQVNEAMRRYPADRFIQGAAETFDLKEKFDYIILSDVLNEMADVQQALENLHGVSHMDTRLVINIYNTLWRPVLFLARLCNLKPQRPEQNWLSQSDLFNLLDLSGWEVVRHETRVLIPHELLGIGTFINRYLAPFLSIFCLSIFMIARPRKDQVNTKELSVSVIIPARNEAGNIKAAIERTPVMGTFTEIIFVEGNSQDNTWDTIQECIMAYPDRAIRAFQQTGKGKGDAMRLGYEKATGELLMILDADLTVPPEDLPKFYQAVASGKADFAYGVRLVYPMEDQAMLFLNMCGNKFFSILFSCLLYQSIKDTLCGTKVFHRDHYHLIEANRSYFGDFDPFGDFDLIFGAAHLNLHIRDIPIRYQSRTYGSPQIDRWRDGLLLFRMSWFAARKLKFFG